jgi:hypothetical protein
VVDGILARRQHERLADAVALDLDRLRLLGREDDLVHLRLLVAGVAASDAEDLVPPVEPGRLGR